MKINTSTISLGGARGKRQFFIFQFFFWKFFDILCSQEECSLCGAVAGNASRDDLRCFVRLMENSCRV